MFHDLFKLSLKATIAMTVSADASTGLMTINVIPKPKEDLDEPALGAPLSLTATPDEFQADFINVLTGYRQQRESLTAQAELTSELLAAAKDASAKKGTTAVAKAAAVKPAGKAKAAQVATADTDDEGDNDESTTPPAGSNVSAVSDASAPSEPSLFGPGI